MRPRGLLATLAVAVAGGAAWTVLGVWTNDEPPAPAATEAVPDAVLDAMKRSVCGDGDYPDPRDPASIPGFGAPVRVVGGAGGDQS